MDRNLTENFSFVHLHINVCYKKAEKKKGIIFRVSNKHISMRYKSSGFNSTEYSLYWEELVPWPRTHAPAPCTNSPADLLRYWQQLSAYLPKVRCREILERSSLANTPFFSLTDKMLISRQHNFFLCCYTDSLFFKAAETFYSKEHVVARIPPPKSSFIFQHIRIT